MSSARPASAAARAAAAVLAATLPGAELAAQPAARAAAPAERAAATVAPIERMAEAERAFARAVRERGIRDAFLAHMADEGLLFRPAPITARVWLVTNPPAPGTLAWEPAWGAASAAGDLGFTTGPFARRPGGEADTAATYGHYVTVWTRQPEGGYRALMDVGVPGPTATLGVQFTPRPLAPVAARPTGGATAAGIADAARATLFIADRGLAAAAAAEGAATALARVAAPDVRILRAGRAPTIGLDSLASPILAAAHRGPAAAPAAWIWRTQEARVARSGDMGVTHGAYEARDAAGAVTEQGSYVRVWAREAGSWRVLLDVQTPGGGGR